MSPKLSPQDLVHGVVQETQWAWAQHVPNIRETLIPSPELRKQQRELLLFEGTLLAPPLEPVFMRHRRSLLGPTCLCGKA